ncbi:hypothetical protein F4808DRAFT_425144 [Astrocystis sublimbata]|nr:hypothetical protein F4808DRAFT_425144 [Astrocystis sublimbata]
MESHQSPPTLLRSGSSSSRLTYAPSHEHDDDRKNLIPSEEPIEPHDSLEQPKIPLRKRFSWLHPLVHILPVAATLGILQLSWRGVYWEDDNRFDGRWINVLQFPAKLHEILIVGSISAIVLHIFRRMLLSTNGIPLGLMMGAFQIGSFEYLISKEYVRPLKHTLTHKHYKPFFVALALGSSVFYSALVGPASAGALIPILAWWDVRTPFGGLPLTSYMNRTQAELYPMSLRKDIINGDCHGRNYSSQGCPAEGWDTFSQWAWNRYKEGYRYNTTRNSHYDPIMISSFSGQAQRKIVTRLASSESPSATAAAVSATLHSSVLALTDAFWHYVSSNLVGNVNKAQHPRFTIAKETSVSIPLVQVQCNPYVFGKLYDDSNLTFETNAMNDFSSSRPNVYTTAEWIVPKSSWAYRRPLNATNITWVDVSEVRGAGTEPLNASLMATVTVPLRYYTTRSNRSKIYRQDSYIVPCVIDARWATTDVTFDTADNVLQTSLTDWLDTADFASGYLDLKKSLSKWKISEPISLAAEWAYELNSYIVEQDPRYVPYYGLQLIENLLANFVHGGVFDSRGHEAWTFSPSSSQTLPTDSRAAMAVSQKTPSEENSDLDIDTANDIAIMLSTVIADWVSRSTFRDTWMTMVKSAPNDTGRVDTVDLLIQRTQRAYNEAPMDDFINQTAVRFNVERYGYGYGLIADNYGTLAFSIVILLMHIAVVLIYFVYSFIFWCRARGWTSNSWGTVGDFVALAIVSPPAEELRNSGAGISHSKTWMTRLRIREGSEDHERLELVVGIRGGAVVPGDHKVKIGKKYS